MGTIGTRELFAGVLICGWVAGMSPTSEPMHSQNVREMVSELREAKSLEEFDVLTDRLAADRRQLIEALIRTLRAERDHERTIRVCYLLGEYRATEAIRYLVDRIAIEAETPRELTEIPRWHKHPAMEAVAKCGTRSIPYLIRKLETSERDDERRLCATAIWLILGGALSREADGKIYARQMVADYIEIQPDPAKKAKLRAALAYFERPPRRTPETPRKGGNMRN